MDIIIVITLVLILAAVVFLITKKTVDKNLFQLNQAFPYS